ncbi:hypothetical protein [Neisseria sp. Ec49-e6-T10]|uniref:hypothetical protein n=1 Tax=Neisseria sp. Ec49-e6-T10 TaxID=3140744 RepID=UPI003EBB2461
MTDNNQSEQLRLLHQMNKKLDCIDSKVDRIETDVKKTAAITGAVAGGVTAGIVSTGIAILKAKLGF